MIWVDSPKRNLRTYFSVNFHKIVVKSYSIAVSVAECCALKHFYVLSVTLRGISTA